MFSGIRTKARGGSKSPGLGIVSCKSAQETWPQEWPLKSLFPNQTKEAGWIPSFTELSRSPSTFSGPGMSSEKCSLPSLLPLFPLENGVLPALWWHSWPACGQSQQPGDITVAHFYICLPENEQRAKGQFQENPSLLPDIKLGSLPIEHKLFSVYWTPFPCPALPCCCNFLVIKSGKKKKDMYIFLSAGGQLTN